MDHAAASTRLQSIAAQKMKGVVREEEYGDPRDGMTASDLDSSSSLERHDHSPRYSDLAASIPSMGMNTLMSATLRQPHGSRRPPQWPRSGVAKSVAQVLSLKEQIQDQRQMMNELSAKFDRLVKLAMV